MVIFFFICFTFLINYSISAQVPAKCYWADGGFIYDLSKIGNGSIQTVNNSTLLYSFCKNLDLNNSCNYTPRSEVVLSTNANKTCVALAGSVDNYNLLTSFSSNVSTGINITFPKGQTCKNNETYQLTLQLICNSKIPNGIKFTNLSDLSIEKCSYTLIGESNSACEVVYFVITNFLISYHNLFGITFMIFGFYFLFFSVRFILITLILGYIEIVIFVLFLTVFTVSNVSTEWVAWLLTAFGIIIGFCLGFFLRKFERIFSMIYGGFTGFFVGLFIYTFFLSYIRQNEQVVYWCTILGCIVTLSILSVIFNKYLLLITTTFTGGYVYFRGMTMYSGGFPYTSIVIFLSEKDEHKQLDKLLSTRIWVVLVLYVLSVIGAIFFQYWFFIKSATKDVENEKQVELTDKN